MEFELKVHPISINKAWRGGARYRTNEYKDFEEELMYLLPRNKKIKGEVEMHYTFYLKNYARTDTSNLIKCLEDVIVKAGLIEDDRKVVFLSAEKIKSNVEKIIVEIRSYGQ